MPPSAWSTSGFSGQSGPPNSMGSSCSGGTLAQLTSISGLDARGPPAWIARAIRLLPVPVSPMISTWPSAWATSRMVSRSFSTAGLDPISRRITTLPSESSRRSARVSRVRARASPALRQSSASRSGSNGFSTKSKAPIRIASTAIGTSPWPVIRITGSPGSIDCSRRSSAMPSMPGMRMSLMTIPAKSAPSTLQRRFRRLEDDGLEARELHPLRDALAHVRLVVDDRDLGLLAHVALTLQPGRARGCAAA